MSNAGISLLATTVAILLLTYVYILLCIAYLDFVDYRSSKDGDSRSRQRLVLILCTVILFIINTLDLVDSFLPLLIEARKALSGGIAQQSRVAENALNIWGEIGIWQSTFLV